MNDETKNEVPAEPETPEESAATGAAATNEPEEQETESFSTESLDDSEISSPLPHPPSPKDEGNGAENLEQIAAAIKSLDSGHIKDGKRNYKEFFEHAKSVGALFKSLKPLPHEEREKLWQEFSALCDDARAQQNAEREEQKLASLELRGKLEAQLVELAQSGPNAKYADDFNDFSNKMRAVREEFTGTKDKPGPLVPRDREALWKLWKSTDEAIWQHRKAIRDENYAAGKEHMALCAEIAAHGDPFACHKKIKELRPWQRSAELAREQRNEIRKSLDESWEAAAARIEAERAERRQQFDEWKERSSDRLSDWEEKLEKMREFRLKLEEQITRLNDMEANARTDEFADQVVGWREEKETKIADVDNNIANLAEKIEAVKKRLK